ncbi:MAG: DNA gyrase inhibitor YacG [Planctomycetes bacterium]|nr:DNA gyrase inhibitor YacG [Planctomycetota bacterium]
MPTYRCKTCGKSRHYDGKPPEEYPFCGERCKLIDLGKWFNGEFVIESDLLPDDLDEASADPDPPLA